MLGGYKKRVYCGGCSLALGEQERHTEVGGVPYHDRCAENAKKGKVIKVDFRKEASIFAGLLFVVCIYFFA